MTKRFILFMLTAVLIFGAVASTRADVAYDKNLLIDDPLFTDDDSMSVSEIQEFLESKGGLLANWVDNVTMRRPSDNCIVHYPTGMTAAEVIYQASHEWGAQVYNSDGCAIKGAYWSDPEYSDYFLKTISPKVILATLQKEQSIVTSGGTYSTEYTSYLNPSCTIDSSSPYYGNPTCTNNNYKLARAMGYGVPDSGTISEKYLGFYNQVNWAVWQLRYNYERSAGNTSWDEVGQLIYRGPMVEGAWRRCADCTLVYYDGYYPIDDKPLYMGNRATASLYYYTPHTYPEYFGNYNFVQFYSDWFGSVKINIPYLNMQIPRYLKTTVDLKKVNLRTSLEIDDTIPAGTEIYFSTKVTVDNVLYLRTLYDKDRDYDKGIRFDSLDEIELVFEDMVEPRWMEAQIDLKKVHPVTQEIVGSTISEGTKIYFVEKFKIGGTLYLRTLHNQQNSIDVGIPISKLGEYALEYVPFVQPRWVISTEDTKAYDLRYLDGTTTPIIPYGTQLYFNYKTTLNGRVFASLGIPAEDNYTGTPLDHLRNIESSDFWPLENERPYVLNSTIQKLDLATGQYVLEDQVEANASVFFKDQISIDGVTYLRSAFDKTNSKTTVIPIGELAPIDIAFEDMVIPRSLELKADTKKLDPATLWMIDDMLREGLVVAFSQKIKIDDKLYLRTTYDTQCGHYKIIPFSVLKEI